MTTSTLLWALQGLKNGPYTEENRWQQIKRTFIKRFQQIFKLSKVITFSIT